MATVAAYGFSRKATMPAKAGAFGQTVWQFDCGLLTLKRACFTLGVYGRAKGAVRSKAEPWNERRVKISATERKSATEW